MRYNEIITEANYKNKFDSTKIYPSQAEFDRAVAKFGVSGANKESKPQAGGAVYILNPTKGVIGYKVPNNDSPEGYIWFAAKEPFMPAAKAAVPAPEAKPVKSEPKAAPKVEKATDEQLKDGLQDLLSRLANQKSRSMWGNYDTNEPEKDPYSGGFHAGIRHWGHWQLPDDADPSDDEYQDYDWEELSHESGRALQEIVQDFNKRYPSMVFSWSTSEKNWIDLYVKAK
jgi:hypothetical protein